MKILWRIAVICVLVGGVSAGNARADAGENLAEAKRLLDEQLSRLRRVREGRLVMGSDTRRFDWPTPDTIEGDWKEGILRPGEPITFEEVTARWVIPDATETRDDELGWLSFSGPSGSIDAVPVPAAWSERPTRHPSQQTKAIVGSWGEIAVYLDGVLYTDIHMAWPGGAGTLAEFLAGGLIYRVGKQPAHQSIGGKPQELSLYLSSLTPVTLNETEIAISDQPVEEVADEKFYGLTFRNMKTGESETVPLILALQRNFGRYDVVVTAFDPVSRTAALQVQARKDLSVKGRGAYMEKFRVDSETFGGMIEQLGAEYGFEVEWVPAPGYPESVEYARSLEAPQGAMFSDEPLERFLGMITPRRRRGPGPRVSYEWVDKSHLRVRPMDYEEVVADREKEARMEQDREEIREIFEKDYSLATKVFVLRKMKASTARELVDGLLSVFYLQLTDKTLPVARSACSLQESGEAGSIWACRKDALENLPEKAREDHDQFVQMAQASAAETVVADDMSNSIIVTAVPQTHARIQSLIGKMEGLVESEEPAGPVERYRVEVVLLSGGERAKEPGVPLGFRIDGVVEEIPVEPGERVEAGDVLARLNSDDAALRIKELKASRDGSMAEFDSAREGYKYARQMFEKGISTQKEVREAEQKLIGLESQVKVTEAQLEQVELQMEKSVLRAPEPGTVAAVKVRPGQKVTAGETVVVLRGESEGTEPGTFSGSRTESHPAVVQGRKRTEDLMEKYGIAPGDLEAFGLETLRALGRGVVSLAAERGETGKARVSLTDEYACELEFQDVREPYVIVRGRLLAEDREQPLIENTLYLEKDTPSLLGVTNLREGLILVVQKKG